MKKHPFHRKITCIILTCVMLTQGCKKRNSSSLRDSAAGELDATKMASKDIQNRQGYLTAIHLAAEKIKEQGGIGAVMRNPNDVKAANDIDTIFDELIAKAPDEHIKRIGRVTKAEVERDLGRPDFEKSIAGITAEYNRCDFVIACSVNLTYLIKLAELIPDDVATMTAAQSQIRSNLTSVRTFSLFKDVLIAKLDFVNAVAAYESTFGLKAHLPSQLGIPYSGASMIADHRADLNNRLSQVASNISTRFSKYFSNTEQFAIDALPSGQSLVKLPERAQTEIKAHSAILIADIREIYVNTIAFQTNLERTKFGDPTDWFNKFQLGDGLNAEGRFLGLLKGGSLEATLPSRTSWLNAVTRSYGQLQQTDATLSQKYEGSVSGAKALVTTVDTVLRQYLKNDPYFAGVVSTVGADEKLIRYESAIVKDYPAFNSLFYQIVQFKNQESAVNQMSEKIKKSSRDDADILREMNAPNFRYAINDVNVRFLTLFCAMRIIQARDAVAQGLSNLPLDRTTSPLKLTPLYECKPEVGFNPMNGNYNTDSCSHAPALEEKLACGTDDLRNLERRLNDYITAREVKIIFAPVYTKAIIYSAVAVSIIATMGVAGLFTAAGAGAGAATTTAATAAQISVTAEIGKFVVQSIVFGTVFTAVNNAILLATGVKQYKSGFWLNFLGETLMASACVGIFNGIGMVAGQFGEAFASIRYVKDSAFLANSVKNGTILIVEFGSGTVFPYVYVGFMDLFSGNVGKILTDWSHIDGWEAAELSLYCMLLGRVNYDMLFYTNREPLPLVDLK